LGEILNLFALLSGCKEAIYRLSDTRPLSPSTYYYKQQQQQQQPKPGCRANGNNRTLQNLLHKTSHTRTKIGKRLLEKNPSAWLALAS